MFWSCNRRHLLTLLGVVSLTGAATPAFAQDQGGMPTDGKVLYGIERNTGHLMRYDFDSQTLTNVGAIGENLGVLMTAIDAAAHVPNHQNIYGFWTDPSDGQVRLVYIDCESAAVGLIGEPLGAGVMTGATVVKTPDGGWLFPNPDGTQPVLDEYDYTVFGIHEVEAEATSTQHSHSDGNCTPVSGDINLNPNNSPHNEFTVALPGGESFNRDDLHAKDLELDGNGVFYSGPAESVWVKPKGNGDQNTLSYNGQTYTLQNSKTYLISGEDMQITVWNDHVHSNGKAMGHWWVNVNGACVTIEEENQEANIAQQTLLVGLYQVDHKTGQTRHLMALSRSYDGLASLDGGNFLATHGPELYLINPNTQSETLVGSSAMDRTMGLEFAGGVLMGFTNVNHQLVPMNIMTGTLSGVGLGMGTGDLGSIIFTDAPGDPVNVPDSYD